MTKLKNGQSYVFPNESSLFGGKEISRLLALSLNPSKFNNTTHILELAKNYLHYTRK
jgi:hypothetical protein